MKVYVWPDGVWCYAEEVSMFTHKSDDYSTLLLPDEATEDDIEVFALMTEELGYVDEQDIEEYFKP